MANRAWSAPLFVAALVSAVFSACDGDGTKLTTGMGGRYGAGGMAGALDAATPPTDGMAGPDVPGRADLAAPGSGGATGAGTGGRTSAAAGGTGGSGGTAGLDGAVMGTGGAMDAPASGSGGAVRHDAPGAGGSGGSSDADRVDGPLSTGGASGDPCNPPPPSGHHTIHFRYLWAGQRTFTLFPKPELMPKTVELQLTSPTSTVTCSREQDRPWFNCAVPDSAFAPGTTWRVADKSHAYEWNTVKPWPMPATAKDHWLRWYYGKPDVPRMLDPPNFVALDYYPDAAHGDWAAMGSWDDATCAAKPPTHPVTVGFGQGGWFPYESTAKRYPHGTPLSSLYPDATKAQDALDAFVFERYNLWKKNWIKYDDEACGAGTARVVSDLPAGTVSEGQGYGMAMSAAIGDKELFDKLWGFVRHYRSQARYCGLMGWFWQSPSDCQPLDTFATGAGNHGSAFDGDVDIGIGLVYAALQWPEYADAATDWLVRIECEVNTQYGDGWNYPTRGDDWDKNCVSAEACNYDPLIATSVTNDYYPPGYFRVFGDFLAAKLGADAKAANGQTHHDFWYRTAETVYELVERCYDQEGVHPGLIGNGGDILRPCREIGGGEPYEWGRTLWRVGVDAAWFGDRTDLPENAPASSAHFPGKSRMQAKIDNAQGFYADFYKNNPPEPNANRFSSLCHQLTPSGTIKNCDPAYGHNAYTVHMAMSPFVSLFDNGGATTPAIRREAMEEALTTTVMNDAYFTESLGVYSLLFLTGNFPNPMTMAK